MKNEIKIEIIGSNCGTTDKLRPSFGLVAGSRFAIAEIAKLPEAYTITPNGKRFAIAVPSGDCLKVILAARSIASYLRMELGGALKVIMESENWKATLPVYLEAEAQKRTAAAALAAAKSAIKYYGTVERNPDGEGFIFPTGTPDTLKERFIKCADSAKKANDYFAQCKGDLDRVVWSFMRDPVERFFTAAAAAAEK